MYLTIKQLKHKVDINHLIELAQILRDESDKNIEYNRALSELISYATPKDEDIDVETLVERVTTCINT
jgi:hypothetical protein